MKNSDHISGFSGSESDEAYLAAIRAASMRIRQLEHRQAEIREQANQINKLIAETRAAIEGLYQLCSNEAQSSLRQHAASFDNQKQVEEKKTGGYGTVIDLMKRFPSKEWKPSEVKNLMDNHYEKVDEKFIYNALQHFATQGKIVRVRRGLYKILETGAFIEGITSQD